MRALGRMLSVEASHVNGCVTPKKFEFNVIVVTGLR
jgi:hypothetical protein